VRPRRAILGLVLSTTVAAAVAGCGDSPSPPGSPDNPLQARPSDANAGRSNEAAAAPGSRDATAKPAYEVLVERQSRAPRSRFTPCNLVTRAEAGAILGGPIAEPVEAPQGPTCIYRSDNARAAFVTVAVQKLALDRARRQVRDRHEVRVGGRRALCGTHGQPVLYLKMSRGRVLNVTAPCDVATRFARKAAPRLATANG
jgi:hypothetical protein